MQQRSRRTWSTLLLLLTQFCLLLLGSAAATASDTSFFAFKRLIIDTHGDAPQACFRFNQALDPAPEAHYGDYVKIEPTLKTSITIADHDLCLGGLDYATDYKVTLLKGLHAKGGDRLANAETVDVALTDRPALVALAGDGYILSQDTATGVTIQTVNVSRVRVHVLRMSDKLVTSSLTQTRWNRLSLTATEMDRWNLRDLLSDAASVVWSGTMDIAEDHNQTVFTAFPLTGIAKPGRNGIYLVVAENDAAHMPEKFFSDRSGNYDNTWGEAFRSIAAHWVMSTDIALTTMQGADGLHAFARSLSTGMPIPKVDIRLVATGQDVLGKLTSGKDGQVVFPPGLLRGTRANQAASIVAYGPGGDFSILDLNRPAFDLSDRGVSGRPSPGPIEAFIYTDRGIYRPGQTVHLMALLRDPAVNAPAAVPLTLVLHRPDGVETTRFSLPPQPQSGFEQDIPLSKTASRGMWSADALVDPSSPPVGHVEFDVEDFVPQQLKVTLTSAQTALKPKGALTAALDGAFLYGAPAAGLASDARLLITPDPAPVPDTPGYSFGLVTDGTKKYEQQIDTKDADNHGHVAISAKMDELPPDTTLPLRAVLTAGLFEPSGRYVSADLTLPIHNLKLLIGIKRLFADYDAGEDTPARFEIRTFSPDGKPVATKKLHWSLIRENEVFDWFELGNGWTWHYHTVDAPVDEGDIDVPAGKPLEFSHAVEWGGYRLIVTDPVTQTATSVRFKAGWASADDSVQTPDKLALSIEKPILDVGGSTRIRIKAPFAGQAQIVIAGNRLFSTRMLAVPKGGATFSVTADKTWGAGAYVLVSLYRPLGEGRVHDPVRAIGVAWLSLNPKPHTLSIVLGAPDKVVPRQSVTIPLKIIGAAPSPPSASGQTFVTLAAVDEGILQLTRFHTPDPAAYFLGKRRLGIYIRDLYGQLMDANADPGIPHQGGDEGADLGGPGLPVESTRTVALFSGPVAVGADGTARIPIDIPDFEGQLRLMAVAYDGRRIGSAQSTLIVRDPVVADVSLPRFLAPGDTARLALSLHNLDGVAGQYHLAVGADGPAKIRADHPLDYALSIGKRIADAVTIDANDVGISTVRADLSGPNGYRLHREWQIAVRSPHYPLTTQTIAEQKPGESFKIDPKTLAGLVSGSVTVSLGYSGYPGLDAASMLQSLWTYPYGCTEQMTSTAFPLLYFNDPALLGHRVQGEEVRARVQTAIDTLLDRQDESGQFGLWTAGDREASPWLNVYTIDFLMRAKEAGFTVADAPLQRAYSWLQATVRKIDNTGSYGGYDGNNGYYDQAPIPTLAYAEYVLARAGHADIGLLRRLHDTMVWSGSESGNTVSAGTPGGIVYMAFGSRDREMAEPISLAQMAGAFSLMGDRSRALNSLLMAVANIGVKGRPDWWLDSAYSTYYSDTRDLAGIIAIEAEIGNDEVAARLVDRLNKLDVNLSALNTQDKAWLLIAAHALSRAGEGVHLKLNGADIARALPAAFTPMSSEIATGYTVTNADSKSLWRSLTVTGQPAVAPNATAQGYSIDKEYKTLDGETVDITNLHQNDRFIVILEGAADGEGDHRTVVVDPLPAGWEIEKTLRNSDVSDDSDYGFLGPLTRTKTMEARDDRFVAAFDLGVGWRFHRFREVNDDNDKPKLDSNEFRLAYIVRVVTPGHFTVPEAVVEDMYRPGVMARTDADKTIIAPR